MAIFTPWRFVTVAEDQRIRSLPSFALRFDADNPDATEAHHQKEAEFAHYADS